MKIKNLPVCKPIQELVDVLLENDFTIIEKKVIDYHFHEIYIKMKGRYTERMNEIQIDKIQRVTLPLFTCKCHWSTVELVDERL